MYRIGEFSMLNQITVKTLRYYDEIELFKPKLVDDFTGYRYYDDNQIDELKTINEYKKLGLSLEEIKEYLRINDKGILKSKLEEIEHEKLINERRLNEIKRLLGEKITMNVEYKENKEEYKIGKRLTLKNRDEVNSEFEKLKKELEGLGIPAFNRIICNFELGYEINDIDVFLGYEVNIIDVPENIRDEHNTTLGKIEFMYKGKDSKCLEINCTTNNLFMAYSEIIKYANKNNLQIVSWFTEKYDEDIITLSCPVLDLSSLNEDYEYYLKKYNENNNKDKEIDTKLVGKWKIREILPSSKYMFNENKQKSDLHTKYEILELNSDGTTNYENINWNKEEIVFNNTGIYIPLKIYVMKLNGKEYLEVLMNESYEGYKNYRSLFYIYERI